MLRDLACSRTSSVTSRWIPKWPMMRPLGVVQADVVAFDVDRRAVEPALVRLDVQLAAVEELAPDARGRAPRSCL